MPAGTAPRPPVIEVTGRDGIATGPAVVAEDDSHATKGTAMWNRNRHPLGKLPLLSGVPAATVERLASLMTPVTVPAGRVLVTEGARNRQFLLIEQGTVRVTRAGQHVADLGTGEFVGEMSLLGDGTANATVTALTDVQAYVSTSGEFDGLLHSALGEVIQGRAAERSVA